MNPQRLSSSGRRLCSRIGLLPAVITMLIAGFTSEPTGIAQTATPPAAGLVGWWKGDGNANDSSGLGHNGTLSDGATFAPGLTGQAFSFGPGFNRVVVPDSPDFQLTNGLTLGAWVYPTANSWGIFGRMNSSFLPYGMGMNDAGSVGVTLTSSAGVMDSILTPIVYNTWTQVTATWDGASGDIRIYLNGVLATNKTTSVIPAASDPSNDLLVGIGNNPSSGGFPFIGLIESVVLYSRALSSAEIALLASRPPSITAQPTNQTAYSGTTVTLSVAAIGTPLTYLWYKDGQPLLSATNSSLVLTNVSSANQGSYAVVVSNPLGVVASQAAQLTVANLSSTIGLYPGITITGFIGSTLEIDYTLDVNTNSGGHHWEPSR